MRRKICFITGTRAEFGLMIRALKKIESHPSLSLQIIATGMHLSRQRGHSLDDIHRAGFKKIETCPWDTTDNALTAATRETGRAIAALAQRFSKNRPDVALIVGDRVEAFAGATAAHLCGIPVAHVHGGDRALGQVDDALRHAITKLSHIHFPATMQSAARIIRLGEDRRRVHRVGSPALDGIHKDARAGNSPVQSPYALLILHPTDSNPATENRRAKQLLRWVLQAGIPRVLVIYPNTDPGASGIAAAWDAVSNPRVQLHRNLSRCDYLAALQSSAMLVGNSSSGIIEAASFGTPVVDIGPRQLGRERGENVGHVEWDRASICRTIARFWNKGNPLRFRAANIYGSGRAGERIAHTLASAQLDSRLLRKLIAY